MDIMKIIMDNLGVITQFLLAIGAVAGAWSIAKIAMKKVYSLFGVIIGAMEDNTLTASEATAIMLAGGDVVAAIRTAIAARKK